MKMTHYTVTDADGMTLCTHGDTPEAALENCSGGADRWRITGTEEIPYLWAGVAGDVAAALSGKWAAVPLSVEYPDCGWTLTRADGLSLTLSPPNYQHKAAFGFRLNAARDKGQYVEVYENGRRVDYPSIHVSSEKSAKRMAAHIMRRLIQEAERVNGLVNEKIKAAQDFHAARVQTLGQVCDAFRVPVPTGYHSNEIQFTGDAGPVAFEVGSGDSVTLKLRSVDIATVRKIAAAIA